MSVCIYTYMYAHEQDKELATRPEIGNISPYLLNNPRMSVCIYTYMYAHEQDKKKWVGY